MNGDQFVGLHEREAGDDEEQDRGELDGDHHRVEARALANADDQEHGDEQDDDRGRQVDDRASACPRRGGHPARQMQAEAGEDALEVAAPADGHGHRPDRVFEDEVPADHPREDLAERRIRVGVGAAGDRDHRRELGVAQRRKRAGEAGGQVRQPDRGAGLVGCGGAGQHEDAGSDDRADAEQREIERRERPLERLAAVLDIADELLDRLRLQQIRVHPPSNLAASGSEDAARQAKRGIIARPQRPPAVQPSV